MFSVIVFGRLADQNCGKGWIDFITCLNDRHNKKYSDKIVKNTANDIAIVAASFEFSNIFSLEDFWKVLLKQEISYTVKETNNIHVPLDTPRVIQAWGGISEIKKFDYRLFGYSYKEACYMDPQHRLLLQHSWQVLGKSGYINSTKRSVTGVFASASINQYLLHNLANRLDPNDENEILIGNTADFLASRIAYKLNLNGPAINIQCGCSSFLVALHYARISILTSQCEMALVGAASLSAPNAQGYRYEPNGIRSKNGKVHAFDIESSGTVFTNGVGVLLIKRLSQALEDNDFILGIIAGSAVNNDGAQKASFTAPTSHYQAKVIEKAMRVAGIEAKDYVMIESHGTGTDLGDAIELEALKKVFRNVKEKNCILQSVKSNVGHLDTLSGMPGILKAALILKNKIIPGQANFQTPNPKLGLENSLFSINMNNITLEDRKNAFIGITALGIGGTNAHVIMRAIEPHEQPKEINTICNEVSKGLICISAKTKFSFAKLSEKYANYIKNNSTADIRKFGEETQQRRQHFELRKAVWVDTRLNIENLFHPLEPIHVSDKVQNIIFQFPGQGSQYINMTQDLVKQYKTYQDLLWENLNILNLLTGKDFSQIIFSEDEANLEVYKTQNTQACLLAIEVALANFLIKMGVYPCALLGHSLGEYTALVISNVLDFESAARLVLKRSELMGQSAKGAMMSIIGEESFVLKTLPSDIDIAAFNGPDIITVSGSSEAIDNYANFCVNNDLLVQKLPVQHAFHSRLLEPILEEFKQFLKNIKFNQPQIPIVSNLTAEILSYEQIINPQYWADHLRHAVNYKGSIQFALKQCNPIFVEVGPGLTLSSLTKKVIAEAKADNKVLNTTKHIKEKNMSDDDILLQCLGVLWEQGSDIQWDQLCGSQKHTFCEFPGYAFDLVDCWIEKQLTTDHKTGIQTYRHYWQATPRISKGNNFQNYDYLILSYRSPSHEKIIQNLKNEGIKLTVIEYVESSFFEMNNVNSLILRIIQAIQSERPVIILNLLLFDKQELPTWREKQLIGNLLILSLYQYCQKFKLDKIEKLIFITNGVIGFQSNVDAEIATLQASIKTVNQESSYFSAQLIDICKNDNFCELLINELSHNSSSRCVALRYQERFVEKFEKIAEFRNESFLKNDDSLPIVILGGAGQVGRQYAQAILKKANQKIYLVQRSNLSQILHSQDDKNDSKLRDIRKLCEQYPERIEILSADIGEYQALHQICQYVALRHCSPLIIIHAAGIDASMHYRLMKDVDEDFYFQSFYAKREGLINIQKLTTQLDISQVHIISSISSILAGVGMFVYGALHSYIDNFVLHQNKISKTQWSSINWEAWEFGDQHEVPQVFQQGAFGSHLDSLAMAPHEGRELISSLWPHIFGQMIVSSTDLSSRYENWVESLSKEKMLEVIQTEKAPRPDLHVGFVPPSTLDQKKISFIWSSLLGIEEIGLDDSFFELGGHSLLALQMVAHLNKEFLTKFSIVDLFEFPTIRKLAEKVSQKNIESLNHQQIASRITARKQSIARFKRKESALREPSK